MLARNMGRKPLPKSEVKRVISVSLKPTTITALDRMRGDTARSKWVEEMIEHLLPIHMAVKPQGAIYCTNCYRRQDVGTFNEGDEYQCHNRSCSLKETKWFKVEAI